MSRRLAFFSRVAVFMTLAAAPLAAPGQVTPGSADATTAESARDVLAAEQAGDVEIRFIADGSRAAQIVVSNRSDRPLTLRLPAAFAGVPVLAQIGGGMGQPQGVGFGSGGIGGAPQNVGGGGMNNAGMGIGGGGMGGNPFGGVCWVAREVYGVHDARWKMFRSWLTWQAPAWLQDLYLAHGEAFAAWLHDHPAAKSLVRMVMDRVLAPGRERALSGGSMRVAPAAPADPSQPFTVAVGGSRRMRVATVCLDYGRPEPTTRMPYRLAAVEGVSPDPRVALLLQGLASGHLTSNATQAAVWHVANGRTWEQLAAEVIHRAGGDPDLPVFSSIDLQVARRAVDIATRLAAETPQKETLTEATGP
jgi:hypothetical protein